jgi:hypothetical protein
MKELVIKVKVITDGVVHHMTEAFMKLKVFLTTIMAIMALNDGAAV